jgi:hypothetical protein
MQFFEGEKIPEKLYDFFSGKKKPETFNVYFYGEDHQKSEYKNNLMIHTQLNEQVDYHLLVEGLFYTEESNPRMQGIEYAPAKWLGYLLTLHLYFTKLKGVFFFGITSDNPMFTWNDNETKVAVAEILTKLRFFFKNHDIEKSYPYHFLTQLNQQNPKLKEIADYCIKKWQLSSLIDTKKVDPSWLYGQDLTYFKDNFNSFLELTVCIIFYLYNDSQIQKFLTNNSNIILNLSSEFISSNMVIRDDEYTNDYYETQVKIFNKALILSCFVRETFIVGNLKHFLENKNPCKDVIVILGDAHVQNIESNFKDVLGDSLIVQNSKYSFIFWPLTRQQQAGNPIDIKSRDSSIANIKVLEEVPLSKASKQKTSPSTIIPKDSPLNFGSSSTLTNQSGNLPQYKESKEKEQNFFSPRPNLSSSDDET